MGRIEIDKPVVVTKQVTGKVTIHDVYILDASGSMGGHNYPTTKAYAAIKGCIDNIVSSITDETTNKIFTVCVFSDSALYPIMLKGDNIVPTPSMFHEVWRNNNTALYDAIGETINIVSSQIKEGEKVSIKIFTDGEENASERFTRQYIASLIKAKTEEGWNISFIGTERDTKNVISLLNIDKSNTMVYDGTAKGFEKTMEVTRGAMTSYSTRASKGEDVSLGFFKEIQ